MALVSTRNFPFLPPGFAEPSDGSGFSAFSSSSTIPLLASRARRAGGNGISEDLQLSPDLKKESKKKKLIFQCLILNRDKKR